MYTLEKDRIVSLDMTRGFAILGIFFVNMLSFHSPFLYLDPFSWWESSIDQGTYIAIDVLAQGSFYPLFSLLFGFGLVLLYERTTGRGQAFYPIAFRRLFTLLAIGIIHTVFIWHGDILINYALLGLLMLLFMKLSGKGLLITGTLIWLIPNIVLSFLFIVVALFVPGDELSIYNVTMANLSVEVYQQGSYFEILQQRLEDWYLVNNPANFVVMLFSIFPFFLIGGGMAKLKLLERVEELKKAFLISFVLLFSIGLMLKLTPYIFGKNIALEYIQDSLGGPMVAISILFGFALWAYKSPHNKLLRAFAPIGKLSMSNYLLQSVVATFIFYSYGLGLYGKVSVLVGTIIVVAFYSLQVWMSSYWLRTHRFGPVEWVWRCATYKKIQPWKR